MMMQRANVLATCAKTGRKVKPVVIARQLPGEPNMALVRCPSCQKEYEIPNKWLEDHASHSD